MVISDSHRFIFLAVPKTGSSSIEAAFELYTSPLTRQFNKHATARTLMRDLPGEIWRDYFKFAFVRNPYDRIESWYYYRQREELADPAHPRHNLYTGDRAFAEFVDWFPRHDLIFKQTDFIAPLGGGLLIDRVCRFENLQADFASVCEQLRLPVPELGRLRMSTGRAETNWTVATRRIVNDYFAEDFSLFNYPVLES